MPIQFLVGLLRSLLNPMLTMYLITTLIALTVVAFAITSRCVSVVMPDELFAKMEAERGREFKSSFVNHILAQYFKQKGDE